MILELLLCVVLFLVVFYSAQLIRKFIRNFYGASVVRTVLFFVPYVIPLWFLDLQLWYGMDKLELLVACLLAVVASLAAIAGQYKNFKVLLTKDIYYFMKPTSSGYLARMQFSLVGSAIAEELFYRAFLPTILLSWGLGGQWLVCSFLFSFSHYLQKDTRKTFNWKSYLVLFLLGTCWALASDYANSIIPAIAGHLVYNVPHMVTTFFGYYWPHKLNATQ